MAVAPRPSVNPMSAEVEYDETGMTANSRYEGAAGNLMEKRVGQTPDRIPALDFTKGMLVLIMVLYHWLNYFVSSDGDIYRYLRFLTPSFIFITGFLISHAYLGSDRDAHSSPSKRLAQRGLKLLAVFLILNAARTFLIPDARTSPATGGGVTLRDWIPALVSGNVSAGIDAKGTAFNILVPIGYLLLLSAGLVRTVKFYKYAFHTVCLALFLIILVLQSFRLEYGNLEMIAIGMLGAVVGYVSMERIVAIGSQTFLLAACYVGYVLAITVWNVGFLLQIVGVLLNLIIIFRLGRQALLPAYAQDGVILLGRYSLFGYIAQIAILQVLIRLLRSDDLGDGKLVVSFVLALALTVVAVVAMDQARRKLGSVDRLYKAIFA